MLLPCCQKRTTRRVAAKELDNEMNIKCFFIKDCIDKGHLTVEHCPIDARTGDHPSKPLQGRKFETCKALTMGRMSIPSGSMLSD